MPKVQLKFVSKTFGAGDLAQFIRPVVENLLTEDLGKVKAGHEKYVESWETALSTPEFYIDFEYEGMGTLIASVKMEAESAEDATLSVWQLLNREGGTAVRYMQISKDWKSKTWPVGSFPSNAGAGYTTGLGPPQKGIESRHIAEVVADEVDDIDIQEIYEYALSLAFAGD